jgi:hypothetical protein
MIETEGAATVAAPSVLLPLATRSGPVRRCRKTGQLDKLRPTGQLRCETWA